MQELEATQKLQTRKAILEAVPQMVNRFTGHEVFSETSNKAAILDKLAMKVSPQDLDLMVQLGKLTKDEAVLLAAQFAAIVEEKRKEHEALKRVPSEEELPTTALNGANGKGD